MIKQWPTWAEEEFRHWSRGFQYLDNLHKIRGYVTQNDIQWAIGMINRGCSNFLDEQTIADRIDTEDPIWPALESLWPGCRLRTHIVVVPRGDNKEK